MSENVEKKKIDYDKVLIGAMIVVVLFGIIYSIAPNSLFSGNSKNAGVNQPNTNLQTSLNVQSNSLTKTSDGEVTIDLTPKKFENGKFYVEIDANTHTFNGLSDIDLGEVVTLEVDGDAINPSSAPAFGGHHNSGTLIFDVSYEPKEFTITIKDIPDVETRVFTWN